MENNKNLEAVDEVIHGMKYLIEQASNVTTKSYDGLVVEKVKENIWKIKINNADHNVKMYGDKEPNVNDMVKVFVPQGNYNLAWFFVPGGGDKIKIDTTLTKAGEAADAKAVGNAINGVKPVYNLTTPDRAPSGMTVDKAIQTAQPYMIGFVTLASGYLIKINKSQKVIEFPPYASYCYREKGEDFGAIQNKSVSYADLSTGEYNQIFVIWNKKTNTLTTENYISFNTLTNDQYIICWFSGDFKLSSLPSNQFTVIN